ncbi:MAG: hypothetical protein Hals2KO_29550 [Halioglobus sp.]
MFKFRSKLRQARNWWFRLCTGKDTYGKLDEEHFRQRILVMTSASWLLAVIGFTVVMPLLIRQTPQGSTVGNILLATTASGVLISMLILRYLQDRVMALNVLLLIFFSAFASACAIFGGTDSPTITLLLLVPVLAGIVGSVSLSVGWSVVVLAFWASVLIAESLGMQFTQIIKPQNHSLAMLLSYGAMTIAVVVVLTVYAEMNKALRHDLQRSNEELAHLSSHDQLTGLPNRRFYDERLALALQRSAERGSMMGLLYLDLNDFKEINDNYGHGAGDKLLMAISQRMQTTLRETDLIARLGGDEFAAALEDIRSPDEVTRIAHKLSQAIEQPVFVRQHAVKFSASIGVAIFPIDGRQKQELEDQADKAMYYAKKRGIPVALSSLESKSAPYPVRTHTDT